MSDRLEEFKKHWAGIQDFDEIDPQLVAGLIAEVERLRGELAWCEEVLKQSRRRVEELEGSDG